MYNNLSFSDLLNDLLKKFERIDSNVSLVSFCIKIPNFELIDIYSYFIEKYPFSSFWEENDGISYIALDKCKYITLNGPDKYEIAKKFHQETCKNLINLSSESSPKSFPKLIYFFSFSDNRSKNNLFQEVPNMESVLPKILIIKEGPNTWLRMNAQVNLKISLREVLEEFWLIRNEIIYKRDLQENDIKENIEISNFYSSFYKLKHDLSKKILKGIKLVEEGFLEKIVIGSRLNFKINNTLNIIEIIRKLKINQPNTLRYVWKRNSKDITFGATPETLFSFNNNILTLEAIAGTSPSKLSHQLLNSKKDLREHNLVLNYLYECLKILKINNYKKAKLKVSTFGDISHLSSLIYSNQYDICPFKLLDHLHPSPAVCGYPKDVAQEWIDTIESFERGNYASPIGWIDNSGNSDFRVAIRGARLIDQEIQFTAGAGIVKGSICAKEIEEIKLKFESLVKQIFSSRITK